MGRLQNWYSKVRDLTAEDAALSSPTDCLRPDSVCLMTLRALQMLTSIIIIIIINIIIIPKTIKMNVNKTKFTYQKANF